MKFGFVTCVELGLACMREIYAQGGSLELAITLKDELARTKSGRVYLDDFCGERRLDLLKIKNVNDPEVLDAVAARGLDWLFIIGWSQIARAPLLAAPRRGVLGMHPTLLPVGRGRAAIPWAIIKGLSETGVTLFKLDTGVDTGPIISQHRLRLSPEETSTTLYKRVTEAHSLLIRNVWSDLATGQVRMLTQDESLATIWPERRPEDGLISPTMTPAEVDRLVRAVTRPYPGATWREPGGRTLRIWAGRVAREPMPAAAGTVRLAVCGGSYDATEVDIAE